MLNLSKLFSPTQKGKLNPLFVLFSKQCNIDDVWNYNYIIYATSL